MDSGFFAQCLQLIPSSSFSPGRCDAECAITCYEPGAKYDALSGIGKVRGVETELNVLCLADDPYEGLDNGLVHEFSHTIHKYGIPYINGDWWNKVCYINCPYYSRLRGIGLDLCCLMTPGLSKDIQCHV